MFLESPYDLMVTPVFQGRPSSSSLVVEAKVKTRVRKFPGHEPNRLQLAALLAPSLQTSLGESLESFIGPQQ